MMRKDFINQLDATGNIHLPLKVDNKDSLEEAIAKKPVLAKKDIWKNGKLSDWSHTGLGGIAIKAENGENYINMTAPVTAPAPEVSERDPNYTNFGAVRAHLKLQNEDWTEYNRISFDVKPDFTGNENVTIIASLINDGEIKIPDVYHREGYHVINLKNHEWNHIIWEFPDLPREKMTELILYMFINGRNGVVAEKVDYLFGNIMLEKVEITEFSCGWGANPDSIIYSTSGYLVNGEKKAITTIKAEEFELLHKGGEKALSGKIEHIENSKGSFGVIDFSSVIINDEYFIRVNGIESPCFAISNDVLEASIWKTINFLFCERCGYPVPGIHGACHFDCIAEHNGKKIVYNGGWHDAGDMSQQTIQSGEIMQALFETANSVKNNQRLYLRLIEEAQWGLDLLLRTRFGDGYRVTSAGMTRYTENIIGDADDIQARVHNDALENFIFAGLEAYAAFSLKELEPGRADYCMRVAKEDFAFAMKNYEDNGIVRPSHPHEHTYTTGPSVFFAEVSLAASHIYRITGEEYYAQKATEFTYKMLLCQETGSLGLPLKGFFYRDIDKKHIVHFNHQSREQIFMQALEEICLTQPDNVDLNKWEFAMRLYAQYLKDIVQYTKPYGMIPAGVYSTDEIDDLELFKTMNFGSRYELERQNMQEQILGGAKLSDEHYLRCFPVWFSFRGNCVVSLAAAKSATILGRYFSDAELTQIGIEQVYWILGKNPFGQSTMFGEGKRFAQQYATSSGEMVGELPVGIESFNNEDIPYWPQGNNCTYKEVWTSPARAYLAVAADLCI